MESKSFMAKLRGVLGQQKTDNPEGLSAYWSDLDRITGLKENLGGTLRSGLLLILLIRTGIEVGQDVGVGTNVPQGLPSSLGDGGSDSMEKLDGLHGRDSREGEKEPLA
jgi:hypothetical protein